MRTRLNTVGLPTTSTAVVANPVEKKLIQPTSVDLGLENAREAKHSSESAEHYTPVDIVEAARAVMGRIDLDPASCELANTYIKASMFYDEQADGLRRNWSGRVFLNPPGGMLDRNLKPKKHGDFSSAKVWWRKLVQHWRAGLVSQAVFVGFNLEILQTAQRYTRDYPFATEADMSLLDFPFCIPSERIRFLHAENNALKVGGQPTHANVLVYLPPRNISPYPTISWNMEHARIFSEQFRSIGRVVIP